MIQRDENCPDGIRRAADISDCGRYRYFLRREWDRTDGRQYRSVCFVMLNPSTADGMKDDPTVRKCIGFAKRWGYNILVVRNLFPYRATDPRELLKADSPIGGDRGDRELATATVCDLIVAAWGASVPFRRWEAAESLLWPHPIFCLKKSKEGFPCHPLYVPYDLQLQPFWNCDKEAKVHAKT